MNIALAKDTYMGINELSEFSSGNNNISRNASRQSTITSPSGVRVAIYCRISKDDEASGNTPAGGGIGSSADSSSIQTQRAMLEHYCTQQGWEVVAVYQDDGFTGLNMNRPDLARMLADIERKQIDIVITKDLSRLARNYIHTGHLLEEFFPKYGVRYVAVNDSVDTDIDNDFDMTPFRAVMNQMYSADVSRKVRSAYVTKAREGKFTGCLAPFGYRKHPDNHNQLIPDEDTSGIVKFIFQLATEGKGPNHIRRRLEDEQIPTPTWWNRQKGLRNKTTKFERENPETGHFIWDFSTIKEILANPVYIGNMASQKQVYKFKAGWIKDKPADEWLVVENTHEPIISREDFEIVQEKVKSRKRPDAWGNYGIFAGLIKCGQCGSSINMRKANQKSKEYIFTCSKYNKLGVKHCTQHKVKYETLYTLVLGQIQDYAAKALADEAEVIRQLSTQSQSTHVTELATIEKSITADTTRLSTLDRIIAKLYEDITAERITQSNFDNILAKSQAEQLTLQNRIQNNQSRLDQDQQEHDDNARWIELIKEYTNIQELDAIILQRLIKRIVVHEDVNTSDNTVHQTVEIYFNLMAQADRHSVVRG